MRILPFFALVFCLTITAQTDTEVHLLYLEKSGNSFKFSEPINISNNDGYDNQPSFYNNNTVLFSSNLNGQTEIGKYSILERHFCHITNTEFGSEYSPTKIPGQQAISSIRLDKDGKQLLYKYDYLMGTPEVLINDLVIGYHAWANQHTLASFVLGKESSLVVSDITAKTNKKIETNIGRSLHKIPNSNLISYISKKNRKWEVRSLDVTNGKTQSIINTIPKVEDMCWTPDGTIFMAKDKTIYFLNPDESLNWKVLKTFNNPEINNISRLAVNQAGTYMAFVAEVSPEHVVQKQLEAYNNRDIEGFMRTFFEDVRLYSYPDSLTTEGAEATRKRYQEFFEKTPNLHSEIKNRIVIGNVVIDEEFITANNRTYSIVAMYEVENGKIIRARFIRPKQKNIDPAPVLKQNEAYNNQDLKTFLKAYDEKITLSNYPNLKTSTGKNTLSNLYGNIFKNVKGIKVKIDRRIIIGDIVIDEEHHDFNGANYRAVSVYKIKNGKIVSVTSIQE